MDNNFSVFLEENYQNLLKIVDILQQKFEYVSLLGCDSIGKKINISEKATSIKDSDWQERGFVVRVFKNGLFSEYSFDHFNNVDEICEKIIQSAEIKEQLEKSIYTKKAENECYNEEFIEQSFSKIGEYHDMSLNDILSTCKKIIDHSMEEYEYIISAQCDIEFLKISKVFISNKKKLKQVYAWANASYKCIVNKNEVTKFNLVGASGVSLYDTIKKLKTKIKTTNEDAVALLDAEHVQPGEYECITSPEISGLIAHEAFGHGVEMDMFVKNRAMGKYYIDKPVGSELVEMHEGAIPYNDVSSYYFDDEGTLAQDTIEIKKGILLTGIADAIAAKQCNIQPTGNGKRENYQRKAYTRMTTTYFSPRKALLQEMIGSIQFGYLIDGEISGMEDPKNWGIQCIALIGKEIRNGALTGKVVSPLVITGNVLDVLNSVSMVSNDFELFGTGACGKGYKEWVKTSIGGPYMKVKVKLG